jgi:hypothetical protein
MRNYRQHTVKLLLTVLLTAVTGCAASAPRYPSMNATQPTTPNVVYLYGEAGHRFVIDKASEGFEYHSDNENVVTVQVENGEVVAYTHNAGNATVTNREDAAEFVFAVRRPQ